MEVEEAIERMELLGHEAFMFKNIKSNGLVYKRKDGTYGLVEPKRKYNLAEKLKKISFAVIKIPIINEIKNIKIPTMYLDIFLITL